MSFVDDDEISISSLNSDVNEETLDKDLKKEIEVLENTQKKEPYEGQSEEEEEEEEDEEDKEDKEDNEEKIIENEYQDNFEISDEEDDDDDDDDDDYFQRLDELNKSDIINKYRYFGQIHTKHDNAQKDRNFIEKSHCRQIFKTKNGTFAIFFTWQKCTET